MSHNMSKRLPDLMAASSPLISTFQLKVINIYNFQQDDWSKTVNKKDLAFANEIASTIKQAESDGFIVFVLGDFNLDSDALLTTQSRGSSVHRSYKLINFFINN